MISWINREYKDEYTDSAKASGIRYWFYDYGDSFDPTIVEEMKRFEEILLFSYSGEYIIL